MGVILICGTAITSAQAPGGAALEAGFKSLFSGQDLSGWEGVTSEASASWKVADNMIVCTGQPGTWLRSKEQVDDFNLRLEYKLRPGGKDRKSTRLNSSHANI